MTSFGNGLRVGRVDGVPGRALLRNSDVTSIRPLSPDLATILPLTLALDLYEPDFAAGDLDRDTTILTPVLSPFVFYALDGPGSLNLVKTPAGRLQILY